MTGLFAVGPLVRSPVRLVYDSHEVFLESGTATRLPATIRRALQKYEPHLTQKAEARVTVSGRPSLPAFPWWSATSSSCGA